MAPIDLILYVAAFILFALSTFWAPAAPPRFNLQSAGLACWALTFIV